MPRQARLDIPGVLHHIMVRGINKKVIFRDPGDKDKFLERLGENIEECKNFQISRKEIEGGSRRAKASKARAVIARRCVEDIGLSAAEIARELGVNTSSITRALTRVEADNAT